MVEEYFDKILPPSGKGRPRIVLNEKGKAFIVMLSKYMVTEEEIASEMDVTVETLHNKWNLDTFLECKKKGQGRGKVSLRRYQFKLAEKNATMAIFLGKHYLDQADFPDAGMSEDVVARANLQVQTLSQQLAKATPAPSIHDLLAETKEVDAE